MTPPPRLQDASPPAAKDDRSRAPSYLWVVVGLQLLAVGGLLIYATAFSGGTPASICQITLACVGLGLSVWLGNRACKLESQLRELKELLPDVYEGREPIESLSRVGSLAEPLAIACTDMARELRMERARTQQLQEEVRLKVAGRTEALERTIGALRQQAARDGLTGLFNRRMLDAYLPEAIERCRSAKLPLAVLMIDVDNFKPLNDTLGHAAGDQMLKSIAQIIRSTISETDLAFRNGGDEFVIVFEGCAAETARLKQERLNSLGKALGRTFRLTPPPTLSIGMTMLADLKDATAPALLRQADQSLYTVKAEHHTAAPVAPPTRRSA